MIEQEFVLLLSKIRYDSVVRRAFKFTTAILYNYTLSDSVICLIVSARRQQSELVLSLSPVAIRLLVSCLPLKMKSLQQYLNAECQSAVNTNLKSLMCPNLVINITSTVYDADVLSIWPSQQILILG